MGFYLAEGDAFSFALAVGHAGGTAAVVCSFEAFGLALGCAHDPWRGPVVFPIVHDVDPEDRLQVDLITAEVISIQPVTAVLRSAVERNSRRK